MMSTFVRLLLAAAGILAKFSESNPPGTLKWDGKSYAASAETSGDIQAAKWWGVLTALAGLLNAQAAPLNTEQKRYLERLLFGGMGSLNDLTLDANRLGPDAVQANKDLDQLRKELFDEFQLI